MAHPRNTGSQKDLFNLSVPLEAPTPPNELDAIRNLARQGIRVNAAGDNHWILRGHSPLPEIHCYSVRELQTMAVSNARHYLTHHYREPA